MDLNTMTKKEVIKIEEIEHIKIDKLITITLNAFKVIGLMTKERDILEIIEKSNKEGVLYQDLKLRDYAYNLVDIANNAKSTEKNRIYHALADVALAVFINARNGHEKYVLKNIDDPVYNCLNALNFLSYYMSSVVFKRIKEILKENTDSQKEGL